MPPILVRPADEHRVAEAQGNGRQTPRLRVKEGRTRGIVRLSADGRVPVATNCCFVDAKPVRG